MKRSICVLCALMLLVSMLNAGTVFAAADILDVANTGLQMADLTAYNETVLPDSLFVPFADPDKTVTVSDIDFQEYVMTFDYQTLSSGAVDNNFLIFIGNDSIRFTPERRDPEKGDIFVNTAANAADISDTWNDRKYDVKYWFDHNTTEKYNIYLQKSGVDLTIGVKGPGEENYSWVTIPTYANAAGATLKMKNNGNGYGAAVTSAKVYVPKGNEPVDPSGPANVILTEGTLPAVELDGYLAKTVEDSAFAILQQNSKNMTIGDIDFQNYVCQFDYQTLSADFAGDQNFLVHIGKDAIRFRPRGGNDKIQLYTAADASALPGNWEDRTHLLSYAMKAETAVTYNIYLYKNNVDLVFGIKESGMENYSWAKIATNANDAGTAMRMETTGFGVGVSNMKIWTPKTVTEPMPEVDTAGYERVALEQKTLDILKDTDYSNKDATFANVKPTDYVLTFDFTQKKVAGAGASLFYIFAGNDVIKFFPANDETKDVWYRVPQAGDNWTHADLKFQYDLANDVRTDGQPESGTTYEVYLSKTGTDFVFGIREKGETAYTWFKRTAADGAIANDGESALVMQTFGFHVLLENVQYLQPAVEKGPMPEVTDFTSYQKAVIDSALLNGLQESDYAMVGIPTIRPTNYVMKFQYTQKQAASESNQLFWIYAGNDVVKLLPFNGTGIWHRTPDPENYPEPAKGILSEQFDAAGYKHTYALKNDTTTTYDIYMSKFGTKLVFGIKEMTEDAYEWFELDGKSNTGNEELPLTFRTFAFKSAIENLEYYVPKDYVIAEAEYTTGTGTITVRTNVTRQGADTKDKAIFVTAVYQTIGGLPVLYDLQATEETTLTYNAAVPFSNVVDVPASGGYTIKSFLWNAFDNLVPLTGDEMSKTY